MSDSDDPTTQKRRKSRRRSLRVPVDEVPRPQSTDSVEIALEDVAEPEEAAESGDGSRTVEMPAFDDGRMTLETIGRRDTLDGGPAMSPPIDLAGDADPAADAAAGDDAAGDATAEDAPRASDSVEDEPDISFEVGASVEVDIDAELDDDFYDDDMDAQEAAWTRSDDEQSAPEAPEVGASVDEFEESSTLVEPLPEDSPAPEPIPEPAVRVVVQRVVTIAAPTVVMGTSPEPTPEPEEVDEEPEEPEEEPDEDEGLEEELEAEEEPEPQQEPVARAESEGAPTEPGTELAVDMDEPEVVFDEEAHEDEDDGPELEELDVDLEESAAAPPVPAAAAVDEEGAPALDGEDLLEEAKHPSKPPPPPANKGAPPPPPSAEANKAPAAAPAAAPAQTAPKAAPKPKKTRRKWWEGLFNDDYLRTVPIPHPKTIQKQCDFIEQRLGLAQGSTILDVGCGLGLHAVELTRRGYLVVGLDLSLPMLSRAADEAQDHGLKINFLHADMREMNFDGAFDAVLCWGTTLGYFDDDTNKLVIDRLYKALKPRGLLLLDVVNRDYVIHGQPNLVWFEGDASVVMEETQMNYISSRLEVKRTVILDDGRQRDNHYSLRLYSLHELGQMLHLQGFRVVQVSGREAHPGVFFGADSPKLIILAERRPQQQAAPPAPPKPKLPGPEPVAAVEADEPELSIDASEAAEPSDAVSEALAETLEQSQEELARSGEANLPVEDEEELDLEEDGGDESE